VAVVGGKLKFIVPVGKVTVSRLAPALAPVGVDVGRVVKQLSVEISDLFELDTPVRVSMAVTGRGGCELSYAHPPLSWVLRGGGIGVVRDISVLPLWNICCSRYGSSFSVNQFRQVLATILSFTKGVPSSPAVEESEEDAEAAGS